MTDHASEQAMELEALEAILMDDLILFDGTNPDGWKAVDGKTFKVLIDPREEGEEPDDDTDEKLMVSWDQETALLPCKWEARALLSPAHYTIQNGPDNSASSMCR